MKAYPKFRQIVGEGQAPPYPSSKGLTVRVCVARGSNEGYKPAEAGYDPTLLSRLQAAWFSQQAALSLLRRRHEQPIKASLDAYGVCPSRWHKRRFAR